MATAKWVPNSNSKITMIGPKRWRNATVRNLRISQTAIRKTTKEACLDRRHDSLPNFREHCIEVSNTDIFCYMRKIRGVVFKLREVMDSVNEEIKSLLKKKEHLEKILENTRKDLLTNKQTQIIRATRPPPEKEPDGADCLMKSERLMLTRLKKILEKQFLETNRHLQELDEVRNLLKNTIQERRLVLNLINDAASSVLPNVGTLCPIPKDPGEKMVLGLSKVPKSPTPNPLSPFTPEAASAIDRAEYTIQQSKEFRKMIFTRIEMSELDINEGRDKVCTGVSRKVAETALLNRHLYLNHGRNRASIFRSDRHCDYTDISKGYSLGPINYNDLRTSEKLDRPLVEHFQRHVGGQLPEAENLIKATEGLDESLKKSRKNATVLRLTKMNLKDDIINKNIAMNIDSAIVRLKRRRSDYRWPLEGKELFV